LLSYLQFSGVPENQRLALAELVQPNLHRADEIEAWAVRLFDPGLIAIADEKPLQTAGAAFFEQVDSVLNDSGDADWSVLRPLLESTTGQRGGAMMKPLRLALTGLAYGPALGEVIRLMPPAIRQARLQRAIAIAAAGDSA
jgi:glutamyl-tRNA synthetase